MASPSSDGSPHSSRPSAPHNSAKIDHNRVELTPGYGVIFVSRCLPRRVELIRDPNRKGFNWHSCHVLASAPGVNSSTPAFHPDHHASFPT
jgi:hypothetical protein